MDLDLDLQKKLGQIWNDDFCEHLVRFLIKEGIPNREKQGEEFFRRIEEWKDTFCLEEKRIKLIGVKGWYFFIDAMEFLFDFYSLSEEEIEEAVWKMFLVNEFSNLDEQERDFYRREYNEEFFQNYYPEFQKIFLGREAVLSDFEKNICDEFQFAFSKGCVVQLTKELWTEELERYGRESSERFSFYCDNSQREKNMELIEELKGEYPRYQELVSILKHDLEIGQVFRVNEHNCEDTMFYIGLRKESVYFFRIEDFA